MSEIDLDSVMNISADKFIKSYCTAPQFSITEPNFRIFLRMQSNSIYTIHISQLYGTVIPFFFEAAEEYTAFQKQNNKFFWMILLKFDVMV